MSDWQSFLRHEDTDDHRVDFKCVYVDMAGDLIAGLLLSQIVYWNLPSKNGSSKLRVQRQGHWWLAKKYKDWYDECRISERQARQAVTLLEEKGLITTAVFRFAGSPTVHIRVNPEQFLAAWEDAAEKQAEADRARDAAKSRQMDMTPTSNPNDVQGDSSTETTAETTTVSSAVAEEVVEPPVKKTRGRSAKQQAEDAASKTFEDDFVRATGIPAPDGAARNSSQTRVRWWVPLRNMLKQCNGDTDVALAVLHSVIADMRQRNLPVSAPQSAEKMFTAACGLRNLQQTAVASSGGKPWYADGGSMRLPVQTSHGRGNDG